MIQVTSAPETEPVSLAEVKSWLRLPSRQNAHDDKLTALITAARLQVESDTRRSLVTQTLQQTNDAFPADWTYPLRLERAPVQSVTSIQYRDDQGATQTWESSKYRAILAGAPARIQPVDGEEWPETDCRIGSATITFVAGYGAAADVPQTLKTAILQLIEHWFDHSSATEFQPNGGELREVVRGYGMIIDHERWDWA